MVQPAAPAFLLFMQLLAYPYLLMNRSQQSAVFLFRYLFSLQQHLASASSHYLFLRYHRAMLLPILAYLLLPCL